MRKFKKLPKRKFDDLLTGKYFEYRKKRYMKCMNNSEWNSEFTAFRADLWPKAEAFVFFGPNTIITPLELYIK